MQQRARSKKTKNYVGTKISGKKMPAKIIAGRNPCYAETWLCEVDTILCQFEFSWAIDKCKI